MTPENAALLFEYAYRGAGPGWPAGEVRNGASKLSSGILDRPGLTGTGQADLTTTCTSAPVMVTAPLSPPVTPRTARGRSRACWAAPDRGWSLAYRLLVPRPPAPGAD